MNAGFFRRFTSTLIDMTLVIFVIYLSFILVGRSYIQGQIENYDVINDNYNKIMTVYNQDLVELQEEYQANQVIAGEDEEQLDAAWDLYVEKSEILRQQNLIDTEPYVEPLGTYITNTVYYYIGLFLLIATIYTLAFKGFTLGRRAMGIELSGPVNLLGVFLHDIVFKYLLVIVLVPINILIAIMLLMLMGLIDTGLIAASRNKNTIRDMITKITVTKRERKI